MSTYYAGLLADVGILLLGALSVYIILATGQLSLGNAGFMGIGAYLDLLSDRKVGMPLTPALVIAAVASGVIGVIVGFPALRLKGIYLAMATLGFGEMVRSFFLNLRRHGRLRRLSRHAPHLARLYLDLGGRHPPAGHAAGALADLARNARGARRRNRRRAGRPQHHRRSRLARSASAPRLRRLPAACSRIITSISSPAISGSSARSTSCSPSSSAARRWRPARWSAPCCWCMLPEYLRFLADWRFAAFGALLIAHAAGAPPGHSRPRAVSRLRVAGAPA